MTREEVIKEIAKFYECNVCVVEEKIKKGIFCLGRLRHRAILFPQFGVNGVGRDCSDWLFIDMEEKLDTNAYGTVYYF